VKILVVDDDRVSRGILRAFLQQHSTCSVVEAADGVDALAAVQKDAPALVFLDLGLPMLSGIEVLEALRRDAVHARMPVVVMSGTGDGATVQKAIKLGVEDFLVKPLRPVTMEKRILRVLEGVTARQRKAGAVPGEGRREGARRMVVADRDASFRTFFQGLYQDECQVIAVATGVEALRACLEAPTDLVCVGEGLPLMAEDLLTRKIREVVKNPVPQVVLCWDQAEPSEPALYDGVLKRSLEPATFRAELARFVVSAETPHGRLRQLLQGEVGDEVKAAVRETVGGMMSVEVDLSAASPADGPPVELRSGISLQVKDSPLAVRLGVESSRSDASWLVERLRGAAPGSDQEITDAFGELAHTIGGRIVATLEQQGFPTRAGPPWTGAGEGEPVAPVLQVPFIVDNRRFLVGVALADDS
jgi:two-component system chemotaxis response regulator CheY